MTTWQQSHRGSQRYRQAFTYDTIGRLTGADVSLWSGSAYTATSAYDLSGMLYDGSGNLLSLVRSGQSGSAIDALAYAYTSGTNRLSEVTDATGDYQRGASYGYYTYDADGALTRLDGSGATHDDVDTDLLLDRRKLPVLVSRWDAFSGVTTTVSSRYSASGERYWKATSDDGGSTPQYERLVLSWAGASGRETVAGVFTGSTGNTLRYWTVTTPSGEVLGRVLPGSGGVRYYGKDHLGSVRSVVDGSGVVKERHDYDAWGGELEGRSVVEAVTGSERYTGHQWDGETSWLYAGARLYDPFVARWMSTDKMQHIYPSETPYSYAYSIPSQATDPNGDIVIIQNLYEMKEGESPDEVTYRDGAWYNLKTGELYQTQNRQMLSLMNQVENAISMLISTGGDASDIADFIVNSNYRVSFVLNERRNKNTTAGDQNGSMIVLNGRSGLDDGFLFWGRMAFGEGRRSSPAMAALHEIAHAYDNAMGISSSYSIPRSAGFPNNLDPKAETYATHIENLARKANGYTLRAFYTAYKDPGGNPSKNIPLGRILQDGNGCAAYVPGNPCY